MTEIASGPKELWCAVNTALCSNRHATVKSSCTASTFADLFESKVNTICAAGYTSVHSRLSMHVSSCHCSGLRWYVLTMSPNCCSVHPQDLLITDIQLLLSTHVERSMKNSLENRPSWSIVTMKTTFSVTSANIPYDDCLWFIFAVIW